MADPLPVLENLKVVPAGSALHERYMAALAEQEDRLQGLARDLTTAREALASAEQELQEHLRALPR